MGLLDQAPMKSRTSVRSHARWSFEASRRIPYRTAEASVTPWVRPARRSITPSSLSLPGTVTVAVADGFEPQDATLSAWVMGYGEAVDRPVSATAFDDARTVLAYGTLIAGASARVEGDLSPLDAVPSGALLDGFFGDSGPPPGCDVTVAPTGLRTVGFQRLDVGEGGSDGTLVLANHDPGHGGPSAVGQLTHVFILADVDGRVSGPCSVTENPFGQSVTYDVDLARGWNVIAIEVIGVDAVGTVTDIVIRDAMPGADVAWYYAGW